MISVVIPTYKNKKQLIQNLESNIPHLMGCEIIIVNDNPQMNLKEDLEKYKNIKLLKNNKNIGFAQSVNRGVKKTKYRYVMLLNDDVLLHDESFKKVILEFEKDYLLFAVTFLQKEKDETTVGKNRLYWKRGLLHHSRSKNMMYGYTSWAEGGTCIVDKNKFMELRGFDKLYTPFYWEDIDLSYQAWKTGYKVLFQPDIQVTHWHESTIGKYFTSQEIKIIAYRNQFIFIWKNIQSTSLILQHIIFIPYNFIYYSLKGELGFIVGFINALKKLIPILKERKKSNKMRKIADNTILNQFSHA